MTENIMNLEEFKLVSKEQILEYGLSIPYERTYDSNRNELTYKDYTGDWRESTYDSNSNELTYKDSSGFWSERTYDSNNNELTFKDSDGYWRESTYDYNDNLLTYKDSKGYWYESTYDSNRNKLTHKNSTGLDGIVLFNGYYILYYNKANNKYKAGCQELIYEECISFYNKHSKEHKDADKILEAIKEHHNAL